MTESTARWEEAARHFTAGRLEQARAILEAMLAGAPGDAAILLALAHIDIQTGRVRAATRRALAASRGRRLDAKMLCDIAGMLLTVGEARAARSCLQQAAAAAPSEASLRQKLALQFQNLGDHDAALAWMQRARAAGLDDRDSRFCMGIQLTFHGRMREAERELESCVATPPILGRAMAQLSQLRRQTPAHNHLALLDQQLQLVPPGSEDRAAMAFARYKECEDLERYADAWRSLADGNAMMHALLRHDSASEQRTFAAIGRQFAEYPPASSVAPREGPAPIFVVGMPRSGTTLLDRLLGNHPEVRSAGELGTFRRCLEQEVDRFTGPMLDADFADRLAGIDCAALGERYLDNSAWRAEGRRFFVDKMPRNWLLVPLIRAALPGARIVHMTREPMGLAFSNYRSYFGPDYPYSYDVRVLAHHYGLYLRLMRQWHALAPGAILDVSFHALVNEPESQMRKVLAFCGLAWNPACVDPGRNESPVATPSAVQVRGGIDTSMERRWNHYAPYLGHLHDAIAAVTQAPT